MTLDLHDVEKLKTVFPEIIDILSDYGVEKIVYDCGKFVLKIRRIGVDDEKHSLKRIKALSDFPFYETELYLGYLTINNLKHTVTKQKKLKSCQNIDFFDWEINHRPIFFKQLYDYGIKVGNDDEELVWKGWKIYDFKKKNIAIKDNTYVLIDTCIDDE